MFLIGNTSMAQRALCQNTKMILFLNFRTIYLFNLSHWIKARIMLSNFSLDLCFFTFFAYKLPGFSIGGTFGLRLVKNSNSAWKYCISMNKCPGSNILTWMSNQERMIKWDNIQMSLRFDKYKMCLGLKEYANTKNFTMIRIHISTYPYMIHIWLI